MDSHGPHQAVVWIGCNGGGPEADLVDTLKNRWKPQIVDMFSDDLEDAKDVVLKIWLETYLTEGLIKRKVCVYKSGLLMTMLQGSGNHYFSARLQLPGCSMIIMSGPLFPLRGFSSSWGNFYPLR